MATCTIPSSLTLTHVASSMRPQNLTPSIRCFNPKPHSGAFSRYPMVLKPRKAMWFDVNSQRKAMSWPRYIFLGVFSIGDNDEEADNMEEKEGVESGDESTTDTAATPKTEKGKATLPTKEEEVSLRNGNVNAAKIAVLSKGEKLDEAKNVGVDLVGGEDLIKQIKGGFIKFDKLIASPNMMPKVASLVTILGPRGLMPNFITADIAQAITELKEEKIEYMADETGYVHLHFGKVDFSEEDLFQNLIAVVESIELNKPTGVLGEYWKSAHISSAMGPSIELNIREIIDTYASTKK